MNKKFIQEEQRNVSIGYSIFYKFIIACFALTIMACTDVKAQNTDLPNPTANLQTAPAGSLIIAMDNTHQANPGYFNLKAYGLVVTLMDNFKNLRWVIKAGKAKDAVDINVNAHATVPVVLTATSKISVTANSAVATVNTIVGTLVVGMKVTAPGVTTGTTIASINNATHITLSAPAVSTQSNKSASYSLDTYPASNYNFKAGPFVIFPSDTSGVLAIINTFNSVQPAATKVNVFRTTASVTVDVRYNLTGVRPKGAILNDGGNSNIHVQYMLNASIPTGNYMVFTSATGLTVNCFTFASEPHNGSQGVFIDSIKRFVTNGGNFLAQCLAISSYENWTGGHFQTTQGINGSNGNISANVAYVNPDLAINQFEGYFNGNTGGSLQTWTLNAGSNPQNNFYGLIKGSTAALANTYGLAGAKLRTGKGGNVYYIGNHNFDGITVEKLNGQRVYLNAFLIPALTPACPEEIVLPVQLKYFAAKKYGAGQVQLTWATLTEQHSKEFVIERSADGLNFTTLTRVAANGSRLTETAYSTIDHNPLQGKNFYRLIQVDIDGSKVYSSIVVVNRYTPDGSMDIFPNPAKGQVNINMNNVPAGNNHLQVFDMAGKPVINDLLVSGDKIKVDIALLKTGTYYIKVTTKDGAMIQQKMIVIN